MRVKICRKEAKEARYWLNLTEPTIYNSNVKELLLRESTELMSIFGSIIRKME